MRKNNRKLYESIMRDVAKTVKRHLDESDRLSKIKNIGQQNQLKKNNEKNIIINQINLKIKEIKKLAPRIKELMNICKELVNNGLPLGKKIDSHWGWNNYEFVSSGFHHNFGFCFYRNKFVGLGIEDNIDIIVDENGDFVYEINPNSASPRLLESLERFLNKFDSFESRVFEFVDNL